MSDSSGSGQLLTSLGRRKLLRTVAGLGTASLAGCSGTNDSGGPSTTSTAVTETGFTDDSEIDFESFFVVPTYTNSDGSPVDPAVKDIYWATDIQRELYETGGEAGNPPLIIVPDVIDTRNKPSAVGDTDVYAAYIPYGVSVRLRESVTAVDSVRVEAATAMFEDQRYPADDGSTGRAPDTQTHTFSRDELVEGTTVDSRQMQTDGETQDSEQSGASFEFLFEKIPTTNGILLPANIDVSVKFFDSSGELITEKSQRIVATIPNSGAQGVKDLINITDQVWSVGRGRATGQVGSFLYNSTKLWTAAQAGKLDGLQDLECNELACQAVFTDIAAFNQALSETNSAFEEYEGRISAAGGIQVGRFESAETVTETKTPTPTPTPESAPTDTSVQPSISVRVEYLADTDGSVEINLLELNGAESVPFEINVSAAGSTVRGSLSAEGDQAVASGLEAGETITITYDGQRYSKFTYPEV